MDEYEYLRMSVSAFDDPEYISEDSSYHEVEAPTEVCEAIIEPEATYVAYEC